MAGNLKALQLGTAAEHMVCADLILKGFTAFMAGSQLPYDVLVDIDGIVKTIQVKATSRVFVGGHTAESYRFGIRTGKGSTRRFDQPVDFFAFVATDIGAIAYLETDQLRNASGVKTLVEFKKDQIASFSAFPPIKRRWPVARAVCHPERKHFALGKCKGCYNRDRYLRVVRRAV